MSSNSDVWTGAKEVLERNWREGRTDGGLVFGYTCPDDAKYPDQFFWDSCFHALAWSRIDPRRAMQELRSLAASQMPSGLIGHTVFWRGPVRAARALTYNLLHPRAFQTATIQPPLLGWVWAEVAARSGDGNFADEGRAVVRRFHEYLDRERGDTDGLIGILQPDETGLDATPAYDQPLGWRSHPKIGFLALQAFNRRRGYDYRRVVAAGGFHATDVLVNTAWILGWEGLARLGEPVLATRRRCPSTTRSSSDCSIRRPASSFPKVRAGSGCGVSHLGPRTAPLALSSLPASIGHQIANEQLLNPRCFWLDYPVPSTAACEPTFVPGVDRYLWIDRYWRGPTWLFSTWFIQRGLLQLGYETEAAHLADRTMALIRRSGFREYFNPNTGEGMGAKNFAVSTIAVECAALLEQGPSESQSVA